MRWGSLIEGSQHRRIPRQRWISPWVWDLAAALGGILLLIGFVAAVVLVPDAISDMRDWHVEIVAGQR